MDHTTHGEYHQGGGTNAIALAFLFGYALSTLPLLRAGLGLGTVLGLSNAP